MTPDTLSMSRELESALVESFGSVDAIQTDAFKAAARGSSARARCWLVQGHRRVAQGDKSENGVNRLCFGQTT